MTSSPYRPLREKLLAGTVAVLTVVGGATYVAMSGDGTDPPVDCTAFDPPECHERAEGAPAGTTTTSNVPSATSTSTTVASEDEPYPHPDVAGGFDTSVAGPYRSSSSVPPAAVDQTGNFRVICEFSHLGYYDPILAPGSTSFMHLHMFWGNTGTDGSSTYASLRSGGDGTCNGGPINRTAYWMPTLHDQNGDVVVPELFIAYYKTEQGDVPYRSTVSSYPNGFRYLGGRNPTTNTLYTGGIEWKCASGGASSSTIPNTCPQGTNDTLIVSVRFPHCWDGIHPWLPDNAHVAGGGSGNNNTWAACQAPFPVYLPSLTEFAHFPAGANMSAWYLSSDRMHPNPANWYADGASFHADWFGAWDDEIEEIWVEECLRGLLNSTSSLCDGTALSGAPNYTGPSRIAGWTPLHPSHGGNGWPTGMGP